MTKSPATKPVTHTKSISVLDMAFFELESAERMANIGPLIIIKPPAGWSGRRFADALMARMMKQGVGEPFNLVYRSFTQWQLPRLETCPEIDLRQHCRRLTLPAPGTRKALFNLVCKLHVKRLSHARPLWEFYLIDGLQDGRVAIYGKVHHGLIDGLSFIEVLSQGLETKPGSDVVRAPWQGLPSASSTARKPQAVSSDALHLTRQMLGASLSVAAFSRLLVKQALHTLDVADGAPLPFVHTGDTLMAPPSIKRSFSYCVLPLRALKAFGKAHGATVNDILLTVVDMALNRYLNEHQPDHPRLPLVADMPVALRGGADGAGGGNRIAAMQIPLGAPNDDPIERLHEICQHVGATKDQIKGESAAALMIYTTVVHSIQALTERLGLKHAPTLANMIISNPFGLPRKAYIGGGEVEMALPVSVLLPGQSLNVTAVTYHTGLQIAFLGLAAPMPDIQKLADYTESAFVELRACR